MLTLNYFSIFNFLKECKDVAIRNLCFLKQSVSCSATFNISLRHAGPRKARANQSLFCKWIHDINYWVRMSSVSTVLMLSLPGLFQNPSSWTLPEPSKRQKMEWDIGASSSWETLFQQVYVLTVNSMTNHSLIHMGQIVVLLRKRERETCHRWGRGLENTQRGPLWRCRKKWWPSLLRSVSSPVQSCGAWLSQIFLCIDATSWRLN